MFAVVAAAVALAAFGGSWVDAQHGWDTGRRCTPFGMLCATENGGRTWRGIYVGSRLGTFVRTSVSSGALYDEDVGTLWTRDNGRHWYRTTRIDRFALWRADPARFFTSSGSIIRRVDGWPPRGVVRCRGHWSTNAGPFPPGTGYGRLPRNVCLGATANAGIRQRKVVQLDPYYVADFALIPGGVAGLSLADPRSPEHPYVMHLFVSRAGKLHVTDVRVPPHTRMNSTYFAFTADWPNLYATTLVGSDWTNPGGATINEFEIVAHSQDGGATWTLVD